MATRLEILADNKYLKDQLVGVYLISKEIEDNLEGIRHAVAADTPLSLDTVRVLEQEVTRLNNCLMEALHDKIKHPATQSGSSSSAPGVGTSDNGVPAPEGVSTAGKRNIDV